MPRIYDIADRLRMPGLEVQATFKPHLLTTRIFNNARAMIASGRIKGSGGAARVARFVLDSKKVPYVVCKKWGLSINGDIELTEASKQEVRDLFDAYIMVWSSAHPGFDEDDRKGARKRLEEVMDGEYSWISMYTVEYRDPIADAFLENRTMAQLANAQRLLTAFEAGTPMPVNFLE